MKIRSLFSVAFGMLALSTVACGAAPGDETGNSQEASTAARKPTYLALGDSIAFGDDGYIPWTVAGVPGGNPARENVSQFVGYPYFVAQNRFGSQSAVTNLGCPGETTGSFFSTTTKDNGCRLYKSYGAGNGAWLHTPYAGTQMDAAVAYIKANHVDLITLDLGGNDLLLAEYACATAANFTTCVAAEIPGVITAAVKNVSTIIDTLHDAGYHGNIVFLTQYATSYTDATQLAAIPLFNSAVGAAVLAHGGRVASGFDTFAAASIFFGGNDCNAGLLIPNPSGGAANGCDKHPSTKGAKDLAAAVTLLSY